MSNQAASTFDRAIADIRATARAHHLATMFGWQDVAHRYRRSRVGAFWLTLNMAVTIGALGLIFGTLFRVPTMRVPALHLRQPDLLGLYLVVHR